MSLQVSTGAASLVAIGLGAGDISSLVSLGRIVGNWWTASSGDEEFLSMLNEDEFNILKRRGLIDIPTFNKRWRKRMRLLASGRTTIVEGQQAQDATKDLSRFTASAVCLVTALDQFASTDLVKVVMGETLKRLLETTENGDDYLRAVFPVRMNAWRSTATLHGFSDEAKRTRMDLQRNGVVLPGLVPWAEQYELVRFLVWLLAGEDEEYMTSSSDIAGLGLCLNQLGMDGLSIPGFGPSPTHTQCRLVYSADVILRNPGDNIGGGMNQVLNRQASITVPIQHPEECVSIFPMDLSVQNRCRAAWAAGQRAASCVSVAVRAGSFDAFAVDVVYTFLDQGSPETRTSREIYDLAKEQAVLVNEEILQGLAGCLAKEEPQTLEWVCNQTRASTKEDHEISDPSFLNESRIKAFTVFQSFFMGYYYDLLFRIVDTDSLALQTVDGEWGFRSPELLHHIRLSGIMQGPNKGIERLKLISILSAMFLGQYKRTPNIHRTTDTPYTASGCVGVIAKRALLVNSILGKCSSPSEIAGFTLIDADVGGVPRDSEGLVRCGDADGLERWDYISTPPSDFVPLEIPETAPSEDVTLHIEPDWEGDPDRLLLCVRYKGRRISTISPGATDCHYAAMCCNPLMERQSDTLSQFMLAGMATWTEEGALSMPPRNLCLVFQAFNRPRLRYAAVGLYRGSCNMYVASNSTVCAMEDANRRVAPGSSVVNVVWRLPSVVIGAAPLFCSPSMVVEPVSTVDKALYHLWYIG